MSQHKRVNHYIDREGLQEKCRMSIVPLSWIWLEILASEAISSLQRELESEADLLKLAVITDFWFPYRCGPRAWGSPVFVQFGGLSLRKNTNHEYSQIWGFEKNNWGSSLTSWYCYPKNRVCLLLGIQPKIRRRKDLLLAGSKAITGALSQSSNIEVSLYCKIGEVLG